MGVLLGECYTAIPLPHDKFACCIIIVHSQYKRYYKGNSRRSLTLYCTREVVCWPDCHPSGSHHEALRRYSQSVFQAQIPPEQRYRGTQLGGPISGIAGVGTGGVVGEGSGAILRGRRAATSGVVSQTGICRQCPPRSLQAQVHIHADAAGNVQSVIPTSKLVARTIGPGFM